MFNIGDLVFQHKYRDGRDVLIVLEQPGNVIPKWQPYIDPTVYRCWHQTEEREVYYNEDELKPIEEMKERSDND